ncbi:MULTISPECIES: hypothetical protein [unclassified Sporosarcina]|uniref:hypothetical protein n=1 Tax=unclassified Sporosarcina TaxID=2647733 RepID=UPI000C163567|nr:MULTISPECIES: hypothetical protein [unclassified Sporosarcina]PIC69887.1 hypothetical protein CSV77_11505 [Sporosarcina sp. P16b]PID25169.1 hypothetical protein CSV60_05945 [Sporosarcina sp. P7]
MRKLLIFLVFSVVFYPAGFFHLCSIIKLNLVIRPNTDFGERYMTISIYAVVMLAAGILAFL